MGPEARIGPGGPDARAHAGSGHGWRPPTIFCMHCMLVDITIAILQFLFFTDAYVSAFFDVFTFEYEDSSVQDTGSVMSLNFRQ